MTDKFFAYDPEAGFDTHATEEEARKAAEDSLSEYREYAADDGWNEEAANICWGQISQVVFWGTTGKKIEFEGEPVDEWDCELRPV